MFYLLHSAVLDKLIAWDRWLFVKINSELTNPFFDSLMPFMRNGLYWAPVYLFLGVFVVLNFRQKGAWWILFFVATVALTDMGGTYLFKHNFGRDRPCADPDFYTHVRLLINCVGHGNSFISNHAANHFGIATFFYTSFYPILKKWAGIAFVWAALIAYAQVYVGIHYPFDVLTGALFGSLIGLGTAKLFNNRYGFAIFDNQPEA